MKPRHRFLAVFAILLLCGCPMSSNAFDQKYFKEEIPPWKKISPNFSSYSLFLVCNPDWLNHARASDLAGLYESFKNLGDSIGPHNSATWFSLDSKKTGVSVDAPRSEKYCQAWGLSNSEGPYVVITTNYPELKAGPNGLPPNTVAWSFADKDSKQIRKAMVQLSDYLQKNKLPPTQAEADGKAGGGVSGSASDGTRISGQGGAAYSRPSQSRDTGGPIQGGSAPPAAQLSGSDSSAARFIAAIVIDIQQFVHGSACASKFTIDAPIKVEIDPCKK